MDKKGEKKMNDKRKFIGSWELGCMVFNSCVYKIFTKYPATYFNISGSGAWLTALYTGVIFLIILFICLRLIIPYKDIGILGIADKGGYFVGGVARKILTAFWLASVVFVLRESLFVLENVAYTQSPWWFLALFFCGGAIVTALCGGRAVYRMHSLLVPLVGIIIAFIIILATQNAYFEYLTPVLGKGVGRVFGKGLMTLFMYSDIVLVFIIMPFIRDDVKIGKTVILSASLGVLINVLVIGIINATYPKELWGEIPMYPLSKTAYFGRFWSRLDIVYLGAFIISAILYLSLALHMIIKCSDLLNPRKVAKGVGLGVFVLFLCFTLTGCYDNAEVEESAYIIGLGMDKSQNGGYILTFQISNPLENGNETEVKEMETEEEETTSLEKAENKTVNNFVVEAEDFYIGLNKLRSHLSKHPRLSHLKVIVFSKELAYEGILDETEVLYRENEIRSGTNLCLAESSENFLKGVNPSLEQSTSRYYELLFQDETLPYAPSVGLREFVISGKNIGKDSVIPIAEKEMLCGMGIFKNGTLITETDSEKAMIYKILVGKAKQIGVRAGNSSFLVTNEKSPRIKVNKGDFPDRVVAEPNIKAKLVSGNIDDGAILSGYLENKMSELLQECSRNSLDILGVKNKTKSKLLNEKEENQLNWDNVLKNITIFTNSSIKIE